MNVRAVSWRWPPYFSIVLVSVLIFQVSVIPDSLGIKPVGRVANVIILSTFFALMISAMARNKHVAVYNYYIAPILLIVIGYTINILRSFNIEALGWFSILLPWMAALSIPFNKKLDVSKSWDIYYQFMLITTVITVFEYIAVFSGMIVPAVIETDRGVFLKGVLSIFHGLDDGEIHYRYYGVFAEPGTAAMFLLIGLTYALVHSKKTGSIIFLVAIYLTDSLGGFVSLVIVCVLFAIWKCNESRSPLIARLLMILIITSVSVSSISYFYTRYEEKQESTRESAVVRKDNVDNFANNFVSSLARYPFGFELIGKSLSDLESNSRYYGSNLTFYVAFVQGGILGFAGYTLFTLMVVTITIKYFFKRYCGNKLLACVFVSLPALLMFTFQRTTIFESALFSFLYASPLIRVMCDKWLHVRTTRRTCFLKDANSVGFIQPGKVTN
ncbi:MAG: O-antigen ligase family protein [Nitrospirae bacterium]|nr:O-antigen ligase family protein [Nitrospirota bacterium]